MRSSRLKLLIHAATFGLLLCLTPLLLWGQSEHPVAINVGGGFTPLVGDMSSHLTNGWHVTGGVSFNKGPFSIGPQFTYNSFGVTRAALREAGTPGGDSSVWSITAEPRLQLPLAYAIRPYVVGGVGYYRRTLNFTQPALVPVTLFDPFFGYVFPGAIGTNQVLKTDSQSGIGGSLGAGFTVKLGHTGTEFFTEARYHYAATGRVPTRMVPVTFGLRF